MSDRRRISLILALAPMSALAQQQPDAGRVLQEIAPSLEAPKPSPGLTIETPKKTVQPGGVQVMLKSVAVSGNSIYSEAQLLDVLGDATGKSYDFAGLSALADRLAAYYRSTGYPFARAYLPPQELSSGKLQINIVEGRYGKAVTQGEPKLAADAQAFLAPLKPGDVIESSSLERVTLLLDDQPGIKTTPIIRPGQELVGTGDLFVQVVKEKSVSGDAGIDNYGNRYTGRTRAHFDFNANSPFMLGDQITFKSLYTDEGMWFGNLGYNLPLGADGLRAQASYAHTYYSLGKDFSNLNATGTADVTTLTLSYSLTRSQPKNLTLSGSYQHKKLHDSQAAVNTSSDKSSDSIPLTLSFDLRDGLGGGGVTYGALTVTQGDLKLDSTLSATDQTTARTAGAFQKLNLDLARLQSLGGNFHFFGRVSAQWANKNLDSSEKFGLGGYNGVRAYPSGEGYGDEGWLTQLELRYLGSAFAPYVFHDAGSVTINRNPWTTSNNKRSIAGSGVGVRYTQGNWSADGVLAWRTRGGKPLSDTQDSRPIIWGGAQYRF